MIDKEGFHMYFISLLQSRFGGYSRVREKAPNGF